MIIILANSSFTCTTHAITFLLTCEYAEVICTTQVPQLPIPQHNPNPGIAK